MKAAVLWERRTPLVIEDLDLADPTPGEVTVRVLASGVCQTDHHHMNRDTPQIPPLVLGHEGAGVVEVVGPGVARVQPGDRVIIAFGMKCGECFFCTRGQPYICAAPAPRHVRVRKGERAVTPLSRVGSFAERVNVDARNLVVIPEEMPIDRAALIACGVTTGIGAVINVAKVEEGASVVVIGIGGVGLNVVQGAQLAGAARIVAVDVLDNKLELARTFGATHVVNARREDPVERVRQLTEGRGADYAFEVIGNPATVKQAYDSLRTGGTAVIVGAAPDDAELSINLAGMIRANRALLSCNYGAVNPQRDFPRYVNLYLNGRIKLDELVSRRFALDEVNQAFAALEAGEVARGVIVFD